MKETRPRLERIAEKTLTYCQAQGWVPLECGISLPVPVRCADELRLRFFVYGALFEEKRQALYPPYLTVEVEYPRGRVLAHEAFASREQKRAGFYPYPSIGRYPPRKVSAMREELFSLFERVVRLYTKPQLARSEQVTVDRFVSLLTILQEPFFGSQYYALNPDFFHWHTDVTQRIEPRVQPARAPLLTRERRASYSVRK
jgi:hypothetical protein